MSKFFELNPILSYNKLLNIVVSPRGHGKSFGTLAYVVRKCIAEDVNFVYIRRSEKELAKVKDKLFDAHFKEGVFQEGSLVVEGGTCSYLDIADTGEVFVKKPIGFLIPLNLSSQFKSSAFPNVKYIIFEEFIEENGRYTTNEVEKFISVVETVARAREGVKLILLGNLSTVFNPYFLYFNVKLDFNTEFTSPRNKEWVCQYFFSEEFARSKSETAWARLIAGTRIGDFILNNANIMDSEDLVGFHSGIKTPLFNLRINNTEMCVLQLDRKGDLSLPLYAVKKGYNKNCKLGFNLDKEYKLGSLNIAKSHRFMCMFREAALEGEVVFEDAAFKKLLEVSIL